MSVNEAEYRTELMSYDNEIKRIFNNTMHIQYEKNFNNMYQSKTPISDIKFQRSKPKNFKFRC